LGDLTGDAVLQLLAAAGIVRTVDESGLGHVAAGSSDRSFIDWCDQTHYYYIFITSITIISNSSYDSDEHAGWMNSKLTFWLVVG
jgi:hypothetical protein